MSVHLAVHQLCYWSALFDPKIPKIGEFRHVRDNLVRQKVRQISKTFSRLLAHF